MPVSSRYLYLLLKLNCLFTAFSLSRNQYTFVHCFRFAGAEIVVLWDPFDSHIPNDFTDVLMITQSALKEKGIYGRFKFRAYASDPANYPGFPVFWINEGECLYTFFFLNLLLLFMYLLIFVFTWSLFIINFFSFQIVVFRLAKL